MYLWKATPHPVVAWLPEHIGDPFGLLLSQMRAISSNSVFVALWRNVLCAIPFLLYRVHKCGSFGRIHSYASKELSQELTAIKRTNTA